MSRHQIYCGNNMYNVGTRRIGTPYECLRKGIGQGLNSDLTNFNPYYRAIIIDNSYCGTGIPHANKQMGTPTSCLRKGIGIGKKLQYIRSRSQRSRSRSQRSRSRSRSRRSRRSRSRRSRSRRSRS